MHLRTVSFSIPARPYAYQFTPSKTALLIIDMQRDFLLPGGFGESQAAEFSVVQSTIEPTVAVLLAARNAGLNVIHTREGHLPDLSDCPETKLKRQALAPRDKPLKVIGEKGPAGSRMLIRGEEWHDIIDELRPLPGEVVFDKPGKGAFYQTQLHQHLANLGISHLIITGVTTECCVTTTVREANDRGFQACVIQDCTGGYREDFYVPNIDMISFADGLFGFTSKSSAELIHVLRRISNIGKRPVVEWNGRLDLDTLTSLYAKGDIKPQDVVKKIYERIESYKSNKQAWIHLVSEEDVLKAAAEVENTFSEPSSRPLLYGIPFSVKDSIDVAGIPTTAACPAYAYTPKENAPTVSALLSLGAIFIGKTNLDQLATGLVGMRSPYGTPHSVFSEDYVSGGSSSGSCVSVGAHQVTFSLATDTAGSGRVPAMFNNIVGFKPTKGCLSITGVVPCCLSQDCIAIECLSVRDARSIWSALFRATSALFNTYPMSLEISDPFAKIASPPWAVGPRAILQPGQSFRFTIPPASSQSRMYLGPEFEELFEAAVKHIQSDGVGGILVRDGFDYTVFEEGGKLLYEGSFVAERVSGVKAFYNANPPPPTDSIAKDILLPEIRTIYKAAAQKFTAADAYSDVLSMMTLQKESQLEFSKNRIDVLIVPTTCVHPTKEEYIKDPIALNHKMGKFTHYGNILDMCGVAVPAGFTKSGMPFGVTFLGLSLTDGKVLEIAERFQLETAIVTGMELPTY